MIIPGNILLYIFLGLFATFVIMALVHLFHAWRFGEHTPLALITSLIFLGGIVLIISGTFIFLKDVPWEAGFDLSAPAVIEKNFENL